MQFWDKLGIVNSLWSSDAIWRQGSRSTLIQVVTATNHYLNQCWLTISKVPWHSSEGISIRSTADTRERNKIENWFFKIAFRFPRDQWVKTEITFINETLRLHQMEHLTLMAAVTLLPVWWKCEKKHTLVTTWISGAWRTHGGVWLVGLLTQCGLVTPYGVKHLDQHWFRKWLVACSAPTHYMNKCCVLSKWANFRQIWITIHVFLLTNVYDFDIHP